MLGRRSAAIATVALALVACNALTGVGDLRAGDDLAADGGGGDGGGGPTDTTPPSTPDGGTTPDGASGFQASLAPCGGPDGGSVCLPAADGWTAVHQPLVPVGPLGGCSPTYPERTTYQAVATNPCACECAPANG